jgi:hypothetical protein
MKASWKIFEEICELALQQLAQERYGQLHCQVKPTGLNVVVDFAFGSLSNPSVLVQVTHSTSKKDSGRKFWRNIGELFEAQVLFDDCAVVGVYFGRPQLKKDVAAIEEASLSGYVNAGTLAMSGRLITLLDSVQSGNESLAELSKDAMKVITDFSLVIRESIDQAKMSKRHIFRAAQSRLKNLPASRSRQVTSFTRGFSKLLLFPRPLEVIRDPDNISDSNFPPIEAGIVAKRPRGRISLTDSEAKWVIKYIPKSDLEVLLKSKTLSTLDKYFIPLQDLENIKGQLTYIHRRWSELTDPFKLYEALKRCHNPGALAGIASSYTWLYYVIIEGLKQKFGGRQKFGLSKVIGRLEEQRRDPKHFEHVRSIAGVDKAPRAPRSIERLISVQLFDWASPDSSILFSKYSADMADLAIALSWFLRQTNSNDFNPNMADQFRRGLFQLQYECNIAAPKGIDYLADYAAHGLKRAGVKVVADKITSAVVERAREMSGQAIRADSGVFEVLRCNNLLLHTQAAYANHPADKCKELTARAASLRWKWHQGRLEQRFIGQKLFLMLDGNWSDSHIKHLIQAGWDAIFYPHEMDDFVSAFKDA